MATVSVRYIVDDVDAAIAFYREQLGFNEVMHPAPTFDAHSWRPSARAQRAEWDWRRRAGDAGWE